MKKWILVAIALMPITASADPIRFEFEGICTVNCNGIGLNLGDVVSGFIETLDGLDDQFLFGNEISAFGFNFGPFISINSVTHFAFGFLASNDARTNLFGAMSFLNRNPFANPSTRALTASLGRRGFWSTTVRYCKGWRCKKIKSGGPSSYTAVPEPGSLGLIGLGLVVLGATRRRRTAA